jgi:hypothetical protein
MITSFQNVFLGRNQSPVEDRYGAAPISAAPQLRLKLHCRLWTRSDGADPECMNHQNVAELYLPFPTMRKAGADRLHTPERSG